MARPTFKNPVQTVRCANRGCFRDFSNQQPHDIGACWPSGIYAHAGKPAPVVQADGTEIPALSPNHKIRKHAA